MIQRVNQQNFFWFPLKFESLWFTSASAMNVKCLKSKLSLERKFSNCCAKFVCLQADYFPLLHHTPPTACKSCTHRAPHLSKTQNRFIFVFVDFPSLAAINKKAKRDENLTYNTSGLCDGNLSRSCVLFCLILQMFSLIRSRQCALLLSFLCDVDTKLCGMNSKRLFTLPFERISMKCFIPTLTWGFNYCAMTSFYSAFDWNQFFQDIL